MRHLALGGLGFESDRRHVATQVVPGDVGDDVFAVLSGEHDDLDVIVDGLSQAMEHGAQGAHAVGRDDRDAHQARRTPGRLSRRR